MTDTFDLVAFNLRPVPRKRVIGLGDTPDGPLVFLECGHAIPYEDTDDIPFKGHTIGCERCRDNPPLLADGALR